MEMEVEWSLRGASSNPKELDEALVKLHSRLIEGQSVGDYITAILLPLVYDRLRRKFPETDREVINDSVEDALLAYLNAPWLFNSQEGLSLRAFITGSARQRLSNRIRGIIRRRAREGEWIRREQLRKGMFELPPPAEQHILGIAEAIARQAARTAEERKCAELLLQGERRLGAYAQALGIADQDLAIQQRTVKQLKDRLKARMKLYLKRTRDE